MHPCHAKQITRCLIDRDKSHRAYVFELREAGDEGVAEILHLRKETQTQILGRYAP
jgi:hypothetical protein